MINLPMFFLKIHCFKNIYVKTKIFNISYISLSLSLFQFPIGFFGPLGQNIKLYLRALSVERGLSRETTRS